MKETTELSKQQLKSKETKERIFKAAKEILKKDGYENLSIKKICEEAGVSNGSFYHHFKTKDDLLSYYIEAQPTINPELLDLPQNKEDAKRAIAAIAIRSFLALVTAVYKRLRYFSFIGTSRSGSITQSYSLP